jgi:RHS repeat-associated protein
MTLTGPKKHTPALLVFAVALLATLLPPATAYADDPSPVDPINDGTGGSSTLALPGQVKADEAREAVTPKAQTTIDPSTGIALSSFAFQLLKARGGAQPGLSLSYNSSNANVVGFAGLGWTLPVSSITRRGAAGMPLFTDDVFTASPSALAAPGSTFDEYLADGELLVPICAVSTCSSAQLLPGEKLPTSLAGTSLSGFMYFRRQSDDGARYFLSPDGQTWLKQERSGVVTQYGHPLDSGSVDPSLGDAIERPAPGTNFAAAVQASTAVHGWELVRQTDAVGNTVYYVWTDNTSLAPGSTLPGTLYLSEVYDTLGVGQSPAPSAFAHHLHLTWALSAPLSAPVETPIWRARPLAQLMTVDVTSASAQSNARALVRRYTLSYTPNPVKTRNRLTSITLEGECATGAVLSPIPEVNNLVPIPSGCPSPPRLTLATYGYAPDPIPGQGLYVASPYTVGTAWNLAAPPVDYVFPGFLDVTGDGAADFLYPNLGTGGPSFFVEPFSATSLSSLVDPTGGQLVGPFAVQNTRGRAIYPLVFGDWLADGALDWLVHLSSGQWAAYGPSGGTFVGSVVNAANCQTGACNAGRSWDVDGDGLPDSTLQPGNNPLDSVTYLTQRAHDGSIVPFGLATPPFVGWENDDLTSFANNNPYWPGTTHNPIWRSVADVDGDGLPDSVYAANFELPPTAWTSTIGPPPFAGSATQLIWLNHGDGSFGSPNPTVPPSSVERNAEVITSFQLPADGCTSAGAGPDSGTDFVRMVDLNLDGMADLVKLTPISLYVCLQTLTGLSCTKTALPPNTPSGCGLGAGSTVYGGTSGPFLDPTSTIFEVADIDGTGVPRVLFSRYTQEGDDFYGKEIAPPCADNVIYQVTVAPGSSPSLGAPPSTTLPGLLTSATLLGGETQAIAYQPIRTLPGVTPIPTSAWVVTNITSNNGLSSAQSPFARTTSVTYSYSGPVYDARDKQFVGFQSVVESHAGDAGAPGLVRTTTYATTACGAATGTPCTGQVDYGWFRMLRGLPVLVEDADTTGANIRATVKYYTEQALYTGLDGRVVRRLPLSQEHRHNFDATGGSRTTFVPLLGLGKNPYEAFSAAQAYPVVLPLDTTPTQKLAWSLSLLGDHENIVDFGQPGVDTPIRTELQWHLPSGDRTAWSYRLRTKLVGYTTTSSGSAIASPPARAYTYVYTPLGQLLTETASLPNEPAPMSTAGGFAAGTPPDATTSTTVCLTGCTSGGVTGIQYDRYGNATMVPHANGRCTSASYDPLFALVEQSAVTYLAGCNSSDPSPISTVAYYDLGLEQPVQKTSPFTSAEGPAISKMRYDGLGRLVELDKPSAESFGVVDPNPALLVQYTYGPYLEIDSTTIDGTEQAPEYAAHTKWVDGFGDTLFVGDFMYLGTLGGGGGSPNAGDKGPANAVVSPSPWRFSGAVTRYSNGLPKYAYRPTYSASGPAWFLNNTNNATLGDGTPPALTMYDGAGRPVLVQDHNGSQTTTSYTFSRPEGASCATVLDPEQHYGGHKGSSTETCTDGHGRVTFTQQVLARTAQGKQTVTTRTTYTATGEPTSITQVASSGSYTRQRTYDALGRMVSQTEPNTGTWQYAYNDSGDLVGIMDARGCGEVLYHDGAGRLLAEDYSPCASSDAPAYSPPNLATGDGTEAFYLYDGHGNLATQFDRAQATTYTYDTRDRPVRIDHALAVPGGSDTLASRYAPHVYSKSVTSYSEADRALAGTTGADAPSLLIGGQSAMNVSYWATGTVQTVTSSYGAVLANQIPSSFEKIQYQQLGDRAGTQTSLSYDSNGALTGLVTMRSAGPWGSYAQGTPPAASDFTTQAVLASMAISYDMVGNPVTMTQPTAQAPLSVWPAGAQPLVKRSLVYWDDYRLRSAVLTYAGATGNDVSGVAGNPYTAAELAAASYPALATASTGNRVHSEAFGYDFRGNVTSSADDAHDAWDRSLGTVTYVPGSDQLATTSHGGTATYDAAGNVSTLTTATGETFEFLFDEMGRLSRAVREDRAGTLTTEDFTYDAKSERVTTRMTPALSAPNTYTVNVFDSLVLKNASFPDANGDYEHDDTTEHLYLGVGAGLVGHVFYQPGLPAATSSNVHVYLQLTDALNSTSYVVDQGTSEVVEAISYQPYGGVDSDWRSPRWQSPREDVRFTGQWDNAEVGLVYMHARYYMPQLGRFISPDPLTIQKATGDLNPYAYGRGSPFRFNDPMGLVPTASCDTWGCAAYDFDQNVQDASTGQLNVGLVAMSSPIDPLPPAPDQGQQQGKLLPTYDESGNMFAYSPGNDTTIVRILTEREIQDHNLQAFATISMTFTDAIIAPEALVPIGKGPQATLDGALQIRGNIPGGAQTISLLQTDGPTFVAANGARPLTLAQQQLAEQLGYTVAPNLGLHAEINGLSEAVFGGFTPEFGVSTNEVCGENCTPVINSGGGWVENRYFGFGGYTP